jgi:hypothetical protein
MRGKNNRVVCLSAAMSALLVVGTDLRAQDEAITEGRTPTSDVELEYWLRNMISFHRYSLEEAAYANSMTPDETTAACRRFGIDPAQPASLDDGGRLPVLPYPGGRHPRIGFLDGAVRPQRETKVSVFTPWQPENRARADYVVVDVPEAIWSNLGLTYLAHTHVPTLWTKQGIELPPLEWERRDDGTYWLARELPNRIRFTSHVVPRADHIEMEMTLTNGTDETLSDLRVQNCVMLKEAAGFNQQTNDNKRTVAPYIACHDESGRRWIITGWKPNHRAWANPPCPCLHSDPRFPDCAPGETQVVRGWLSFYVGEDVDGEVARIERLEWWLTKGGAPRN